MEKLIDLLLSELDFLYDDKIRNEIENENDSSIKLNKKLDIVKKLFDLNSETDFNSFLSELHSNCLIFDNDVIF